MDIDGLLRLACQVGASDVHLTVDSVAVFRISGQLLPVDDPWFVSNGYLVPSDLQVKLTHEQTDAIVKQIMPPKNLQKFTDTGESDFSYSIAGISRFRVNAYKQRGSSSLAIRLVSQHIPSYKDLGLPDVVVQLAKRPRGLILVTGPTGSGKSTTLAAMIDILNREERLHIITLEDPIEFLHRHQKCIINQREIGQDTENFTTALRSAMREDPDVILVGEMRDTETIAAAITAAETGHLVMATLHTASAAQTIDRIIDVFPPYQQQQIRVQLANTIQGVICQQLIPRLDMKSRVVACEIMVATPAIRNLIREGKTYQIDSQIQTGSKYGMQTMDWSLKSLYQGGQISLEQALAYSVDTETMKRMLKYS
ncbi:type IV pilus twitching motility protein PilT [Desulforamulus ferrireducens]|uniref:Type IV pili twitching motility protein PilT n=1 Tax=Desulforamulus ferrireducens TaxID=1833852 RepID=A0A1S6IUN6_9FIRM|nr:type IV pilus twitching motility protein PilT [Desulforamulus ferrireducens]AQS58473.1 type IV pili twitching motility protein PilT [Desulforamulus ferrireducens]